MFWYHRSKIGNTFRVSQFHIEGYSKRSRLDRIGSAGGITIYVREDILILFYINMSYQISIQNQYVIRT